VCFSDGVLEVLPPKVLKDKEDRLLEIVRDHGDSLESVCSALGIEDVSETPDDIAIMTVIKR